MSSCSLYLMYDLVDRKNLKLFVFLSMGLLAVHAGSFLIKTDVPYSLESFCFSIVINTLNKPFKILCGISICYCIYVSQQVSRGSHCFLYAFIESEIIYAKAFLQGAFDCIVDASLYAFWQYQNDWMSLKFHLSDRSDISFKWSNVLG